MFQLISFQENGEVLENVLQVPSFYMLTLDGVGIGYFSTLEAVQIAKDRLEIETETVVLKQAA